MGTSLAVHARGCGKPLVSTDKIMVIGVDWYDKEYRKEGTLDKFFSQSFEGYLCGYKWYSRLEAENLLVLCDICVKRHGWRW